jgi:hypothetical protein
MGEEYECDGWCSDACEDGDHDECTPTDAVHVSYDEYSYHLDCGCGCHDEKKEQE